MEPTAVNYYSKATINSHSWCIEPVEGCMMPPAASASAGYDNPSAHQRQALSIDFNPAATVPGSCTLNYDEHATVPADCYFTRSGCLDSTAINYGCTSGGIEKCNMDLPSQEQITVHVEGLCSYQYPEPPSPPPPKFPSDTETATQFETKIEYKSDTQYTGAEITALTNSIASEYGVETSNV